MNERNPHLLVEFPATGNTLYRYRFHYVTSLSVRIIAPSPRYPSLFCVPGPKQVLTPLSPKQGQVLFPARTPDRIITSPNDRKNLTQPKLPLASSTEDNARNKRKLVLSPAKVKGSFFSCLKLWGVNFFSLGQYGVSRKKLNRPFLDLRFPLPCSAGSGSAPDRTEELQELGNGWIG